MPEDESWKRLVSRVEALAKEEPRTKTGKIQQLLPHIEQSVQAGITLKQLCEELNTEGLKISYRDFRVLLSRVRRKARKEPPAYTLREKAEVTAAEDSQGDRV